MAVCGKNGPRVCQRGERLNTKGQAHGNKPGLGVFAKEEIYKFWISGHNERENVCLFVGTLMKMK